MVAQIIVDVSSSNMDKIFEYSIPENMSLQKGHRVLVPFGKRIIEGYVLKITESPQTTHELKSIIKILDEMPLIIEEQLCLAEYMKKYYHLKMVDILHLFLPVRADVKAQYDIVYSLKDDLDFNIFEKIRANAVKQKALIEKLKEGSLTQVEINAEFGNSALNSLKKMGVLNQEIIRKFRTPKVNEIHKKQIQLTEEQNSAVNKIMADNKVKVLFGVTGSGKTEVYLQCIEQVLKQNKTAIMLVPEISLTSQTMANFNARFSNKVACIHSGLSVGERFDEWDRILKGEVSIVVGARSAIFTPLKNIGLIIIDEEHDTSYFSESNPRYHTHNVAKFRAMYSQCPLVLGSATPSVETMENVKKGNYNLIKMLRRVNNNPMPEIEIVDMLSQMRNGNDLPFSKQFSSRLNQTLKNGEQAMILLNRRGYQSTVRCLECGYVAKCLNCDVSLVYHREDDQLKCHYCNMRYRNLTECPNCHNHKLQYGAIGTQKIEEILKTEYKDIPIFRMDNDTTRGKDGHGKILKAFRETAPSILIGTQMISKGHDYPLVTFVGVVDADSSLYFSDYQATEKAFSLITQVAGRAGRADKKGVVVLQTYTPKHYLYSVIANYDFESFYENELKIRKISKFPPFSKILRILIQDEQEEKVQQVTYEIFTTMKQIQQENLEDIIYLNCMKSPIKRINNKFRFQILFRIQSNFNEILDKIYTSLDSINQKNCQVFVEIDPQNLR